MEYIDLRALAVSNRSGGTQHAGVRVKMRVVPTLHEEA